MALAALAANGKAIAYMFGLSSALAVVHNLVNYKLVQHTSAVSATVIGEVKTIALIILSAFLLGARPAAAPDGAERRQEAGTACAGLPLSRRCLAGCERAHGAVLPPCASSRAGAAWAGPARWL